MEEEILGLEDENSNLLDSSDGYEDYQEEGFDSDTPKGVLTEQEVRDNPFMSLVDYNINHGGAINKFFDTLEYNQSDPFKAATNLSIGFNQKMLGLRLELRDSI